MLNFLFVTTFLFAKQFPDLNSLNECYANGHFDNKTSINSIINKNSSTFLLINFTASWCPYCEKMDKAIVEKKINFTDLKIINISIDKNKEELKILSDKISSSSSLYWCPPDKNKIMTKSVRIPHTLLLKNRHLDTEAVGFSNSKVNLLFHRLSWLKQQDMSEFEEEN